MSREIDERGKNRLGLYTNYCSSSRSMVLYMSSSFWLLGVESRDFSQAEKERTACEAGKIQEMTLQAVFFLSMTKIT